MIPATGKLFVDSSNKSQSIPIHPSGHLKEGCENMKKLLSYVKYEEQDYEVIGDFKRISFLTGLQGDFTKHPWFLYYWDSRAT